MVIAPTDAWNGERMVKSTFLKEQICPNCALCLVGQSTPQGTFWGCARCQGVAIEVSVLEKRFEAHLIQQIRAKAKHINRFGKKHCPVCRRLMLTVTTGERHGAVELDWCDPCALVWFDRQELEQIPRSTDHLWGSTTRNKDEELEFEFDETLDSILGWLRKKD
ncbi:MAG: zf-TFIIB domain-containing protein [Bdellovibrionales bacterium]|nr:zf-TFIIB domain-containing protein [Bdellovibrionales bacterium]